MAQESPRQAFFSSFSRKALDAIKDIRNAPRIMLTGSLVWLHPSQQRTHNLILQPFVFRAYLADSSSFGIDSNRLARSSSRYCTAIYISSSSSPHHPRSLARKRGSIPTDALCTNPLVGRIRPSRRCRSRNRMVGQ